MDECWMMLATAAAQWFLKPVKEFGFLTAWMYFADVSKVCILHGDVMNIKQ